MNAKRTISLFASLSLIVILALALSSCGEKPTAETEMPEAEIATPLAVYTPVSESLAGATVYSQNVTYSVTGAATTVTSEVLKNDIVRYVINNEIVQGRVEAPLSIYQGEPWGVRYKQFDGINTNLDVIFNVPCGEPTPASFTTTQTVTVTCKNPDRDWTITAEFVVHLKTTTDIQPPVPAYEVITWPNLEEGQKYLFCAQYNVSVDREGAGTTSENTCVAGKLVNKLAYRVELYNLDYGSSMTIIGTLSPDNVIGGYPWIPAEQLLEGRVYYVCELGTDITYKDNTEYVRDLNKCTEAVYKQTADGYYEFNDGNPMLIAVNDIAGVFASPRP